MVSPVDCTQVPWLHITCRYCTHCSISIILCWIHQKCSISKPPKQFKKFCTNDAEFIGALPYSTWTTWSFGKRLFALISPIYFTKHLNYFTQILKFISRIALHSKEIVYSQLLLLTHILNTFTSHCLFFMSTAWRLGCNYTIFGWSVWRCIETWSGASGDA